MGGVKEDPRLIPISEDVLYYYYTPPRPCRVPQDLVAVRVRHPPPHHVVHVVHPKLPRERPEVIEDRVPGVELSASGKSCEGGSGRTPMPPLRPASPGCTG